MAAARYYELPEFSAILSFIDSIFSELNMGLLIYHLEDPGDVRTARLIYANRQASHYTGANLDVHIGKTIFDAFPYLEGTEVAKIYAEVATEGKARDVGVVEYEDEAVQAGRYATRAFPMPSDCIGILFDKLEPGANG
jgi:hypothetical protein